MAILRRTERAMIREMCGVKLIDRRNTEELMAMLGLKESLDKMVKASSMRSYGHVLRRKDNNVLLKACISNCWVLQEWYDQNKRGKTKTKENA